MSRTSFITANAWPDEDGKHVWVAHNCVDGRDISMLPYPTWRIGDGQVEPSFSHDLCGIHCFVPFGKPEGHKNGDKTDNRPENLERLDPSTHQKKHHARRIDREAAKRLYVSGYSIAKIAEMQGFDPSSVYRALRDEGYIPRQRHGGRRAKL